MKKILSIALAFAVVLCTFTVLLALPSMADNTVNLIVNGSAEGVYVDDGNGGQTLKTTYDATDAANSSYSGEILANNVYGFRNCSDKWANISLRPISGINFVPKGYFSNYTGNNVIGINTNQQMYQDIELEKNKAYTVSAKITAYPNTNAVTADRFFDMFIDTYAGTITEQYTLPSGKSWNLATGHNEVMNAIKQRFNNPTPITAGSNYYGTGDFIEYSFTFKARDFIEEYDLQPNKYGKYDARFVIHNRVQYILLAEDISITEADMTQFVEVEAGKGGTFIGEVKKDGTKTNVTAVAYYGNEFLGWYDEDDNLVSTDVNYNGVLTKTIIARFAQYNLITDGDFESGSSDTLTEYKNYPKYKETLNNVIAIGDTCIEGSGSEYGAKALYLTPDEGSSNDKIKGLLNIPVTLEKGKTYIWKFSYAFPKVAYDASKHYIQFSVDKSPLSWSGSVEYSFHVQRDSLPALDENSYTWSKNTPVTSDAAARTYNISAANEWVHMYVIFTADTNGTHYLTFGTPQSLTDTVVIDNMSLTEATNTLTSTEIAVEGDGEVVSYRADIPAYRATENCKNSTATFETKEAAPYFSQMVETYYAKPGRGYRFDGWFNAQGENVSSDFALKAFTVGEKYTAKFSVDPNKYVVNGAVETLNGTKGGYVTDTLTGEDYFSGEAVTFKAHAYKGNTFKGWYDGNKLLSKNDVYEHIIDKNATITAKFENNNLFSDSGYENYAPSANLLGSDKEWYVSGADASTEAVVVSSDCYDGTKSLFIKAPEKEIVSRTFAVEANKTYHLAFDWRSVNGDNDAALKSVKVINAETNAVLYSSPSTAAIGAEGWQKFYTNFNTGSVTSVKVIVEYSAAAGALFIDNSSLYDASKCDFKITARVDTVNGVYPGYIVGETDLSASNGDSVNVKVVPYAANTFLGWYSELVCLSTATDYTFTADSYLDLVARFDTGNIFPDAGFENTVAGVELDTVENAYFKNNVSWGSITVKESAARSGSFGVEAIHRNNEFNTILTGLKENTDYELSFWWKMRVPDTTAVFNYVDVNGVQTGKLLKTADGTVSSDEWQQIKLSFNTGRNTEIKVDYKYTSGSTGVYLDDFCLRETNDIQVLAGEGGTVQSTHIGSTEDGAVVTVTATETTGTFLGWYDYNNPQQKLSSDKSYTFTVSKSVALIAYFDYDGFEGINYFVDGGFETGNFKGVVFSHPWNSVAACTYSIVDEGNGITPLSGDKMLKINNRGNYIVFRMPNLKPSTDYTLTFYWNAEECGGLATTAIWPYSHEMVRLDENKYSADSPSGYTKLSYYDSSNEDVIKMSSAYILSGQHKNAGWKKVQLTFNSGATDENILHLTTYGAHKAIYIDGVTLLEGNEGFSDTLVNGDFSNMNAENGWQGEFSTTTESGNAFAVSSGEMQQNLFMETADAYTLRFRAKSMSSTPAELIYGFAEAGVTTLTSQTALTTVSYDTVALTDEWKYYELNFSTWNYTQYSLFIRSVNAASFAIDDVTVTDAAGMVPVQSLTFEANERLSTFENNENFKNKTMNNRDWYEYSTAENHTEGGTQSLLMKYNSEYKAHSFMQESNILHLASGRTYHVSFWAKAETAGTKFLSYAQCYAEGWVITDLYNEVETLSNTEWQKFDYYFTVPFVDNWGGTRTFMMVDGVEGETTCDIYFDDFIVEESERSAIEKPKLLYTQNLSQNYFYPNYHFEDETDTYFGAYTVKADDAFYGDKYLKVKAGDRIVVPVNTRQDWALSLYAEYTLSAAVRGDASAEGYLGVSYTPDGNALIKDKSGKVVTIPVNTGGEWKHDGISFADNSFATVYFVIECTSGSFSVDYISMFNNLRAYEENTDDLNDYSFDASDPDNYVDASTTVKENYLAGKIEGLPEGSTVILQGKKTYKSAIDAEGNYSIRAIEDGTYNLLILAGDAEFATMWGDVTLKNGVGSGLGITRISGEVISVEGRGVNNGVAKMEDTETGYAYLTATDSEGYFKFYIIDSSWELVGTTTETEVLQEYSLKFADLEGVKTVVLSENTDDGANYAPIIVILSVLLAAGVVLVINRRKGENA